MTSSITGKAVSNGSNAMIDAEPAEREHGITRVQEQLVYHVTSLAESVLYEAERLMADLAKTASQRNFDHDGTKGTAPMDMTRVSAVLGEALDCIDVASEQLSRLNVDIQMRLEPGNDNGF
jgi:hypothetical protein